MTTIVSTPQVVDQEITEVETPISISADKYTPISTTPYIVTTVIFLIILVGLSIYAIIASLNKYWPFNKYTAPLNTAEFYRPYGEVTPLSAEEINARNTTVECFYRNSPCPPDTTTDKTCLRNQARPAALQAWIASIGGADKVVCPPIPPDFVWHTQSTI